MTGVRFVTGGAKIPFDLLRQQERGELIVLAGAGISIPAGLPDFVSLTKQVYQRLGERWEPYPGENEGLVDLNHTAPDRTLFALQRRLASGRQRIRQAIEAELATKSPGSDAHYNLLRLSRGSTSPRLITTNFDTLFERAWKRETGAELPSWAVAGMPEPGSSGFNGVFHLHGRLADADLDLPGSDLILNSAEFGDAYLRSGWASRYLYDLLRHANVLIVGYRLSDPPTRYLFEALSADRERFEFKDLYALAPADPGEEDTVGKLWEGRGATPLLYDPSKDHKALYSTLAAWASYAESPTDWAASQARRIFKSRPDRVEEDDWHRLDWILSRGDAARLIAEVNPTSRWLGPIRARLDSLGVKPSLGPWFEKQLGNRGMVIATIRNPSALDDSTISSIASSLRKDAGSLPSHFRQVWRLLISQSRSVVGWGQWFNLKGYIKAGDAQADIRRRLCELVTPIPILSPPGPSYAGKPRRGLRALSSIRMNVPNPDVININEILANWPRRLDHQLLEDLSACLAGSLTEAAELGKTLPSVWDVPSISAHPQNKGRGGFGPITRLIVDLWERLAGAKPALAREWSEKWMRGRHELEQRLWLHALTHSNVFNGRAASEALLNLPDGQFWGSGYQREVMRALSIRWNDFPPKVRSALELRIIKGMP